MAGSNPSRLPTAVGSKPMTPVPGTLNTTPTSRQPTALKASSSGRLATGSRTASALEGPLAALTQKLILKLRFKFGDVAADVKGQEIISQEVMAFMKRGVPAQEDDIGELESKIRARLSGSTPITNTLAQDKRAQVEGDEWAKIYEYQNKLGKELDKRQGQMALEKQRAMRAVLDAQRKEVEARKKAEHDEEVNYFLQEQAGLKEWEKKEEAKKKLLHDIALKLKQERAEQLADKNQRKQQAFARVRAEEAALANKIAYDTKTEFEKEEQRRTHAKVAMRDFLLENETNKRMKEDAKKKKWEEDEYYAKQWEAILDKQDTERRAKIETMKLRQSKTAEYAATLPECKRWIDPNIIERHWREREAALTQEDEARKQKLRASAVMVKQTLAEQIKERQAIKQQIKQEDEAKARVVVERAAAEEQRERERRKREAENKLKFRMELERQMKDNAMRRRYAPITETERKINSQLLTRVHEFQTTGRLDVSAV